ncbi:NepR family anti-sigma factor [Breoghania sp.]|nr:NepR family anti-sigma factor [Breoghania sp.]MDJ0931056.1 NepR family anti-sigma factor [Breoghania sp.]
MKSIYDNVLDEPVPDRIARLLEQLEEADSADQGWGHK